MDRQDLTSTGRAAFQSDLIYCRTHADRVRLFHKHILDESALLQARTPAGVLSALPELAGHTDEAVEFLLKEAFWWAFEESTVIFCTTPEQTNLRKESALFWRILPHERPRGGITVELFILFCEAQREQDAQFLTRFYAGFAECLQAIFEYPQKESSAGNSFLQVKVVMEPAFDFKRRNFSPRTTAFSERATWLKLRPVAGAASVIHDIEVSRQAFVFSDKEIKFADAALERVRQQPSGDAASRVRCEPGGLLDIEFITAVLQIAYGRVLSGDARSPDLLRALHGLRQAGVIGEKAYQDLRAAHVFLTGLLSLLESEDAAAHFTEIPAANTPGFLDLARRMGYQGPDEHAQAEFRLALQHHKAAVERHYQTYMVNLANQSWDEIPATIAVTAQSVKIRLEDLLAGKPRPEDIPALRRMGFTEISRLGARFQALCPNRTAFEPFAHALEKSWSFWPEVPSPDLALENLKRFSQANEDPYRFWYALAKSEKGLRLLLNLFGTSTQMTDIFIENRESWAWVEQTQYLSAAQTLDLLHAPDCTLDNFEALCRFKDRESLRLLLTDLFMGAPYDSLMNAHARLSSFCLQQLGGLLPGTDRTALLGLGGMGAGAAPIGSGWALVAVSADESGLVAARQWLEKITGGLPGRVWARLNAEETPWSDPVFLLTQSAAVSRLAHTTQLNYAAPWLQMIRLAGSHSVSQGVLEGLRRAWCSTPWLEPAALKNFLEERLKTHEALRGRHEEDRHILWAAGGLRDIEAIVTAAWSRRAREQFQPTGLLDMITAIENAAILPEPHCGILREAFLDFQKIRGRCELVAKGPISILPEDGEDFRICAKASGFRDQGIHAAEVFFKQQLLRLRQNVGRIFQHFFNA